MRWATFSRGGAYRCRREPGAPRTFRGGLRIQVLVAGAWRDVVAARRDVVDAASQALP